MRRPVAALALTCWLCAPATALEQAGSPAEIAARLENPSPAA